MWRLSPNDSREFLTSIESPIAQQLLSSVGFSEPTRAHGQLCRLIDGEQELEELTACLPALLGVLQSSPDADGSLAIFERLLQSQSDRLEFLQSLNQTPRKIEILFKLFMCSQFLSEILVRQPDALDLLTQQRQLAEFKSREQFVEESRRVLQTVEGHTDCLDTLRRHQQREILRIAACDQFNLLDLKAVTLQLSLLADAMVQCCLELCSKDLSIAPGSFTVLAFGKLGGEELNYSSDIDLVFLCESQAEQFWGLAQRLIHAISTLSPEGFLYRVDMRLRPWGRSGPLVVTTESYEAYLRSNAAAWEKQALLKARPVAGTLELGQSFLAQIQPLVFATPHAEVRASLREMKRRIESESGGERKVWTRVKTGPGGIRDIEFLTQYLQLVNGQQDPDIRRTNTLDSLTRLADRGLILPGEYRCLTQAYVFQRTIEHALQLVHNTQQHDLPENDRELAFLARRLDYPDAKSLLNSYHEHRRSVRKIFELRLDDDVVKRDVAEESLLESVETDDQEKVDQPNLFDLHDPLLQRLDLDTPVAIDVTSTSPDHWDLVVAGFDMPGDLSLICGLLLVYGLDIESGHVTTESESLTQSQQRRVLNRFRLQATHNGMSMTVWERYEADLRELFELTVLGHLEDAQGQLARRVALAVERETAELGSMRPVAISLDNDTNANATVLEIRADDTTGFLYELTNALAVSGFDIRSAQLESSGNQVHDRFHVTAQDGSKITDHDRINELRAAIVLIKHLTHLLPDSPDPESALLHFRELLEHLFRQENWLDKLASLHQPVVLEALARLLGGSQFLWEDFLRLQHDNLFPVLMDVSGLDEHRDRESLTHSLSAELETLTSFADKQQTLNEFKDREMFRIDMRHILGKQHRFGMFSQELTWLAETIIETAAVMNYRQLSEQYGVPQSPDGNETNFAVCGLGKFGGRELGFASDIELLFVYESEGATSGEQSISNAEFFSRLVENLRKTITAKQRGIFEIDLRLRPHGRSGNLAITLDTFRDYFGQSGSAWPYERQALVKLRPVAGDIDLGEQILKLRDECVFTGQPFDLMAMRALRQRQLNELVSGGKLNAKLSPGTLVDCEYFVQALQITFGHHYPELITSNTRNALRKLESAGILKDRIPIRDAYRFFRRLIDALRMVRGDASDLTVPPFGSNEFEFLSRRLGYDSRGVKLHAELEHHTAVVTEHQRILDQLIKSTPGISSSQSQ